MKAGTAPVAALVLALSAGAVTAEPAVPVLGPGLAQLEYGVFCALQPMDRIPAPGTDSGWLHVPQSEVVFHWPDRQIVPAAIGLAFGIEVRLAEGAAPFAEMRVYRPGRDLPDVWGTGFSALGETLAFFRFDREEELVPGLWRFEAWDGDIRLLAVEFEVVAASALPEIVKACGAVS